MNEITRQYASCMIAAFIVLVLIAFLLSVAVGSEKGLGAVGKQMAEEQKQLLAETELSSNFDMYWRTK